MAGVSTTPTVMAEGTFRSMWSETHIVRRAVVMVVVFLAFGSASLLATGVLSPATAGPFSSIMTVAIPAATGILFIINGLPHGGRAGMAWLAIGLGVLAVAGGEAIYQYMPGQPTPGIADVLYVATYPLLFTGVLLLPHIMGRRRERLRLTLDALAGTVALTAVAWTVYLGEALEIDPDASSFSNVINLLYPIGDLALLIAVLILATRPSAYQFDGRLITLWISLVLTIVANSMYAIAVDAGTYEVGDPLDALWLTSFGFAALTTLFLARPTRYRERADRQQSLWTMVAPYTAIALLFALTIRDIGARASELQVATAIVVALIIARQTVAIREVREVVEKQRNNLVASISHELRTPLAAMTGFMEILHSDPDIDYDDRIEMVGIVRDQGRHLARIVGDLVEIARGRLSSAALEHRNLAVDDLVRSVIEMFGDALTDVDIAVELEPDLMVWGDRDRLRQVLLNYLTNAARYGGGSIEVMGFSRGHDTVIEVHDDGPGVPTKHEIAIWDRFERGVHTYTSNVQGSGLGLAIVRQLAIAHGGQAGYRRSALLGGSCFWISIPSQQNTAFPESADPRHSAGRHHTGARSRHETNEAATAGAERRR